MSSWNSWNGWVNWLSRGLQVLVVFALCAFVVACTSSSKVGPQGGDGGPSTNVVAQAEQALDQAAIDRKEALAVAEKLEVELAGDNGSMSRDGIYAQIFKAVGVGARYHIGDGQGELIAAIEAEHKEILGALETSFVEADATATCDPLTSDFMGDVRDLVYPLTATGSAGKDPRDDVTALEVKALIDNILSTVSVEPNKTQAFKCSVEITKSLAVLFGDLGAGDSAEERLENREARARQKLAIAQVLRDSKSVFDRMVTTSIDVDRQFAENLARTREAKRLMAEGLNEKVRELESAQLGLSQARDAITALAEAEQRILGTNDIVVPNIETELNENPVEGFDPEKDLVLLRFKQYVAAYAEQVRASKEAVQSRLPELQSQEAEIRANLAARIKEIIIESLTEVGYQKDRVSAQMESFLEQREEINKLRAEMFAAPISSDEVQGYFSQEMADRESKAALLRRSMEEAGSDIDVLESVLVDAKSAVTEYAPRTSELGISVSREVDRVAEMARCKEYIENHGNHYMRLHPERAATHRRNETYHSAIRDEYQRASEKFNRQNAKTTDGLLACPRPLNLD